MSDKKNSSQNDRRDFLKATGCGMLAAIVGTKLVSPSTARAADLPPLKTDDPMAKALGYFPDAKKVDVKKWPKRAGAEGAKQYCYNCQFYQVKQDPAKSKNGPCTLFAGKSVESHAWCNSWAQNPAVKG